MTSTIAIPYCVGCIAYHSSTVIADKAIASMRKGVQYAVTMGEDGRVWINYVRPEPIGELLCVANRESDKLWLADEIWHEVQVRAMVKRMAG